MKAKAEGNFSPGFLPSGKKAVFLDRDGTINELVYHQEAGIIDTPFTTKHFKLLSNAGRAVRELNKLGFKVVIVSNQPGIAKKNFSMKTHNAIEKKMMGLLKKAGAKIDAAYYCLHHPKAKDKKYKKNCSCRKPKAGLLLKAKKELKINLKKSYMIGDSWVDIIAGKKAGCKTILLGNREKCDLRKLLCEKKAKPDYIVSDLYSAAREIKKLERKRN